MDDFLGTSSQYAEKQIKLLEKEYSDNQERIARELIESGFLDSDNEENDDTHPNVSSNLASDTPVVCTKKLSSERIIKAKQDDIYIRIYYIVMVRQVFNNVSVLVHFNVKSHSITGTKT
eukprot:717309_1